MGPGSIIPDIYLSSRGFIIEDDTLLRDLGLHFGSTITVNLSRGLSGGGAPKTKARGKGSKAAKAATGQASNPAGPMAPTAEEPTIEVTELKPADLPLKRTQANGEPYEYIAPDYLPMLMKAMRAGRKISMATVEVFAEAQKEGANLDNYSAWRARLAQGDNQPEKPGQLASQFFDGYMQKQAKKLSKAQDAELRRFLGPGKGNEDGHFDYLIEKVTSTA